MAYEIAPGTSGVTAACYPVEGSATVVVAMDDARRVVLIGGSRPLENDRLPVAGNAALSLGLLGNNARVVWHVFSIEDFPVDPQATFWQLVPSWVIVGIIQVAVAVVLLALWRGRRLGGVVPEQLPVVVRASEATEGRGNLYQRAGARDVALNGLRPPQATGSLLGLLEPPTARTGRCGDRAHGPVRGLGEGPSVRTGTQGRPRPGELADALDVLERQVRGTPTHRPPTPPSNTVNG